MRTVVALLMLVALVAPSIPAQVQAETLAEWLAANQDTVVSRTDNGAVTVIVTVDHRNATTTWTFRDGKLATIQIVPKHHSYRALIIVGIVVVAAVAAILVAAKLKHNVTGSGSCGPNGTGVCGI